MIRLSFIYPWVLLALVLLPVLWAITWLAPVRTAPWRLWSSLILRSAILVSLVLALAGAQLVRPVDDLTTVFLVDASDSLAPVQRERALEYIETALASARPGDRAAVVVFGANALVERAPLMASPLGRLNSTPLATRTNIEAAVQLGMALFPADSQKRLVLLSDGAENVGRAIEAARMARVRAIQLDVVPLTAVPGPDVVLSELDAPALAREGQEIAAVAVITSAVATTGRLQVFADGQLVLEPQVEIVPGTTRVPLRIPGGEQGFRRLEVRLEAAGDAQPLNNRAAAFTEVQGPPRILLVSDDPAGSAALQQALQDGGVRVAISAPQNVSGDLARLSVYAAVILDDVAARDLPPAVIQVLPTYVRDLGRGLAMIGGPDSFGAGGFRRTAVAEALPVDLDPQDTISTPDLALALVIDRSGSMAESSGVSGLSKLDLAREAVYQASLGLATRDQITIVVFDTVGDVLLPAQQLPEAVDLERVLSSFGPDGGTDIRSGIEPAYDQIRGMPARIKHVIVLTDGLADSNYADLVEQMRAEGVTISLVAIGDNANLATRQIAEAGGGRFYQVRELADVPEIFLQETVVVAGRDIVEEQFTPVVVLPAPLVRGLTSVPPLYGYNGTTPRPAARLILATPDGTPILAQWQYGLGRAVAWTSDLSGRWGRDWVASAEFGRFVSALTDALLPPRQGEGLVLEATSDGLASALTLTAADAEGRPIDNLAVEGRVVGPDGQARGVRLVQIAPGTYRAELPADVPGVYLAQVAASDGSGGGGTASAGLVVAYSPEYSAQRENVPLLRELASLTGGVFDPAPETSFARTAQPVGLVQEIGLPLLWLALLLWPVDIGVRRVRFIPPELVPRLHWRPRVRRVPAQQPDAVLSQLSRARARARHVRPATPAPQLAPREVPRAPVEPQPVRPIPPAEAGDQIGALLASKRARQKRPDGDTETSA